MIVRNISSQYIHIHTTEPKTIDLFPPKEFHFIRRHSISRTDKGMSIHLFHPPRLQGADNSPETVTTGIGSLLPLKTSKGLQI